MSTLGLAMIVRNSENVLERCLNSCHMLFDEIIIVDTGSTDKTKEIAKKFTDKIYDFEWIDDFSAARNYSFSLCTTDFIMWLDDDDVILEKDIEKIKKLNLDDKEVLMFKYQYSHDQFGASECTLERERIIKRSCNLKWEQPIHEYLPVFNNKTSREDIEIHHFKKQYSCGRNLKILEKIIEKNEIPRNFFYIGREYFDNGNIERAIFYLEKFVKTNGWWEDIFIAYELLAKCYKSLKNENKFFENIFSSIKLEPTRAEPYFQLANFYYEKNDFKRAIHYYEICTKTKRNPELLSTFFPQYYTWEPMIQLVLAYNKVGEIQKAFDCNEQYMKFRPEAQNGLHNRIFLSDCLMKLKRKNGEGKKLNLGCGNKRIEGYVNVDIVPIKEVDEVFNLYDIPYDDNTISTISSEHSLEHVSLEKSKQAVKEWFRVLKPGGILNLYIPDLELCAKGYVEGDNNKKINGFPEKIWYRMTLYGAQAPENGSDSEHQFHLIGFSKQDIKEMLEEAGFIIDYLGNY